MQFNLSTSQNLSIEYIIYSIDIKTDLAHDIMPYYIYEYIHTKKLKEDNVRL